MYSEALIERKTQPAAKKQQTGNTGQTDVRSQTVRLLEHPHHQVHCCEKSDYDEGGELEEILDSGKRRKQLHVIQ